MPTIRLRSSRLLAATLTLAHGAAIAAVVLADIPAWPQAVAAVGLAVNWLILVRRLFWPLTAGSVVAIEMGSDNTLSVQTKCGDWDECEVLGTTYVASYLTILNLRQSDRARRHMVILPDSIDAEDFRNLRVWLRWKDDVAST